VSKTVVNPLKKMLRINRQILQKGNKKKCLESIGKYCRKATNLEPQKAKRPPYLSTRNKKFTAV
jgi:hypothetical protein